MATSVTVTSRRRNKNYYQQEGSPTYIFEAAGTSVPNTGGYTQTQADARFVNITGDVMTGTLIMHGTLHLEGYNLLLNDDDRLKFGNTNDFQIWHNGTNNYIHSYKHGATINISGENASGEVKNLIIADPNAAVDLYYAGEKKFETISSGVDITGDIYASGDIKAGHGSDIGKFRAGPDNNDYIEIDGGAGDYIRHMIDGLERLKSTGSGVEITGTLAVTGSIAVSGNVDGRDIAADGSQLDNLYSTIGLSALTAAEVNQLENIGTKTISNTQWGYLGELDQPLTQADSVTFGGATITDSGGGELLRLTDSGGDVTTANPYLGFHYGATPTRLGYVGYGSGATDTLFVLADTGNIWIRTDTDSPIKLAHNNDVKLETTSSGVDITGNTSITGDLIVDTDVFYVDSVNERVGFGTDDPNRIIDIGDGTENWIRINRNGTYQGGIEWYRPAGPATDAQIYMDSDERLRISNDFGGAIVLENGNVSIGDTDPEGYKLKVAGDAYITDDLVVDVDTLHVDSTNDIVKIGTDIGSTAFSSGFAGSGWQYTDSNDRLTVDNLTVRKSMRVYELMIEQIRANRGAIVVSPGNAKILSVDGTTAIIDTGDDNRFPMSLQVDDLIRCQRWNGSGLKYYIARVDTIPDSETFTFTIIDGVDTVEADDEVVVFGNTTDTARQGLVYITASDDDAPYIDVLGEVDSADLSDKTKVRLGNLDGITDTYMGSLSGYGLYSDNVYLRGEIIAASGEIGGWTLTADELYSDNIWLDAAAKQIAINSQTFGNKGIQLEYNAGNPRAFIGENSYVKYESDLISIVGADIDVTSLPQISDEGLVGHWSFDGGNALDNSGNGNDGEVYGATSVDGISGKALDFNGTDDYIDFGDWIPVSGITARTVTAWVRTSSDLNKDQIVEWGGDDTGERWSFYIDVNGTLRIESAGDGGNSNGIVDDNTWHLVAVTYNGNGELSGCKLWIDGELDYEVISTNPVNTSITTGVDIGKASVLGSRCFDGLIDEVRIYNRALSHSEIRSLYLNPSGNSGGLVSAEQVRTGIIHSENWSAGATGTEINLNDGTFAFYGDTDNDNYIRWNSGVLEVAGSITIQNPDGVRGDINVADGADVTADNETFSQNSDIDALQTTNGPAAANADVTGDNTAASISGQGDLATTNEVDANVLNMTNAPAEAGADVTSTNETFSTHSDIDSLQTTNAPAEAGADVTSVNETFSTESDINVLDTTNAPAAAGADVTSTVIEGGLVTTGTLQVVQGGAVAAGITGNTSGDTSVRFWAGSTFADRASAPFNVTQAGVLIAKSGEIGGWNIDSDAIYTGTKDTTDGYSSSGITLADDGAIHAPDFYVDSDGFIGLKQVEEVTFSAEAEGFGLKISRNEIWENNYEYDIGTVYLNLFGYNQSTDYYRQTIIGNGKGSYLAIFSGEDNMTTFYSEATFEDEVTIETSAGTAATYGTLNVSGESIDYGYAATFYNWGNSEDQYGLKVLCGSSDHNDGWNYYAMFYNVSGDEEGGIMNDCGTVELYQGSDRRLKENITDVGFDAIKILNEVRPREFNWKTNKEKKVIGYIAQEAEPVIPSMVVKGMDRGEGEERGTFMGTSQTSLIPYLHKAILELKEENNYLKEEINQLKNKAK